MLLMSFVLSKRLLVAEMTYYAFKDYRFFLSNMLEDTYSSSSYETRLLGLKSVISSTDCNIERAECHLHRN